MIIVTCPHCSEYIVIHEKETNCRIFRHGVYKSSMKQIHPHTPKDECDRLVRNNQIYGCGKPFKLVSQNNIETAIICDYI